MLPYCNAGQRVYQVSAVMLLIHSRSPVLFCYEPYALVPVNGALSSHTLHPTYRCICIAGVIRGIGELFDCAGGGTSNTLYTQFA